MNRGLDHHVVETEPVQNRAPSRRTRVGSGAPIKWVLGDIPGEGGIEVLDDPDGPVRVVGRDAEDLGGAVVLVADAEGASLVGTRALVGRRFGFEVGGSLGPGG